MESILSSSLVLLIVSLTIYMIWCFSKIEEPPGIMPQDFLTPEINGPLPVQPNPAIQAIRIFTGTNPVILLVVTILFAWRYPISRESHQEPLRELQLD